MAEYTRENPRRSPRNLLPVSYVQTRPYNRSAAVAAAPAIKAPAKMAPAKKAPLKKAPGKKKVPTKKAPAKKAPAKKAPAKKNLKKRLIEESSASDREDGSEDAPEPPAKKPRAGKKAPEKANKKSVASEDGNDLVSPVAPLAEPDADDRPEPPDDEDIPIDGSDFNIYHNRRTLEMWVLGRFSRKPISTVTDNCFAQPLGISLTVGRKVWMTRLTRSLKG
jgi:hypothetical protein